MVRGGVTAALLLLHVWLAQTSWGAWGGSGPNRVAAFSHTHSGLHPHRLGSAHSRAVLAKRRGLVSPPPRQRNAVVTLRGTGLGDSGDAQGAGGSGYPEKTMAAVRRELASRQLECPFPFAVHARDDFFEALLERMRLEDIWPARYDRVDRNKANKQARLDAAMWAVQHSERLQLSREQIESIARAKSSAEQDAWRIAADQHNIRLTVVQVVQRSTTSPYGADWGVDVISHEPLPKHDAPDQDADSESPPVSLHSSAPVDICVVYSAGKYWSTAKLARISAGLDDDWLPNSFKNSAPRHPTDAEVRTRPPIRPLASSTKPVVHGDDGGETPQYEAGSEVSWPPPAPRTLRSVDALHARDNITAVGRSKGAGTTWELSKDVQRAFNPELAVEERRRQEEGRLAETRRLRNFTGWGVAEETLRQVEADWYVEVDALRTNVAKYKAGGMSAGDFVKMYRAHWRRQFQVPDAVCNQTLPLVAAMLKRNYDIDFKGVPLDGYTGINKFYDIEYYRQREEVHRRMVDDLQIDSDVYRGIRRAMDSPVLAGARPITPDMYWHIERRIDQYLDLHAHGLVEDPVWDVKVDVERLKRVKAFINSPPETRDIFRDLIRPGTPGSVLQEVNYTLTAEEQQEVNRLFSKIVPAPEGMTHVEAAVKLEFPSEEAAREGQTSKPSWYHTDDVVMEYGVLKRMTPREMARYVFDQTVRDWDLHNEFKKSAERCGLEGEDLLARLSLLPPRWVPQLADGRPIPVLSWRPPQWEEFLDPSLIAWLDEHDALSSAPRTAVAPDASAEAAIDETPGIDQVHRSDNALEHDGQFVLEDTFEEFDTVESDASTMSATTEEVAEDIGQQDPTPRQDPPLPLPDPLRAATQGSPGLGEPTEAGMPSVRRAGGGRRGRGRRGAAPGPAARSRLWRRGGPPLCCSSNSVEPPDWEAAWNAPPRADSDMPAARGSAGRASQSRRTQPPDWLTDPEARQAVRDGNAWLERNECGWFLMRDSDGTSEALVPGENIDAVLQAVEESRLLGDDEAWRYLMAKPSAPSPGRRTNRKQEWCQRLVLGEWESVRFEARGNAAECEMDLMLEDDEFWLEPDEYDEALVEGLASSSAPKAARQDAEQAQLDLLGDSAGDAQDSQAIDETKLDAVKKPAKLRYSVEDALKRNSYFKSLDEWMEGKRGRLVEDSSDRRHAMAKVPVNRSLAADDNEQIVRDLRDGVFGKSVFCRNQGIWAVDSRDSGRALHSSDLDKLYTVAQAYGWTAHDEMLRRASLRTYSLDDYESFRFDPSLSDEEAAVLIAALKDAGIRFAYSPGSQSKCPLLLTLHRFSPTAREVVEQVMPSRSVHVGEYTAFIPMDMLPATIHNRLCDLDYGEVQYWQAPLPAPKLPPLGHLLGVDDQHAWLVQRKFASWLREDLDDHDWRTVAVAEGDLDQSKIIHTAEWRSLRFLEGKPPPEMHTELVSGRFGSVARLGDLMPRPTAIDFDLSMLMKDVYMIPAAHEDAVLAWLEPEALQRRAEGQALQQEVDALKATNSQTQQTTASPATLSQGPQDPTPALLDSTQEPESAPSAQAAQAAQEAQAEAEEQARAALVAKMEAKVAALEAEVERMAAAQDTDNDKRAVADKGPGTQAATRAGSDGETDSVCVTGEAHTQIQAKESARETEVEEAREQATMTGVQAATQAEAQALAELAEEQALAEAAQLAMQEEARAQGQSSAYATRELSGALGDGVEHAERQADAEQPAMVEETRDPDQSDSAETREGVPESPTSVSTDSGKAAAVGLGALRYAVEQLHPSWYDVLKDEFSRQYFLDIATYLRAEVKLLGHEVYPPPDLIFNAFDSTPFDKVRVVILGQDPYHGIGQAHGLAFSVPPGVRAPPSLQNILKELEDDPDVDFTPPKRNRGDLSPWARQGVLLLNTVLTVRGSEALSHRDFGWEALTDAAIVALNEGRSNLVFVLWGANAQKKAPLITGETHVVLMASHPSPLSAARGRSPFLGSRHFSKINEVLRLKGEAEIDWRLG